MKFSGELTVKAPRAQVYKAMRDAHFSPPASTACAILQETAPDTYAAVFETKVAYMKFSFKVTVEVVRAEEPRQIEAKVEGTPLGIVGRLTATSLTTLTEAGDDTKIAYEVEAALTGKLGSLGQPVLRSKAKEMERQFAARLAAAFATQTPAVTAAPIAGASIPTCWIDCHGSGAAGMYAAIERHAPARMCCRPIQLIGRGGATVMAQMTVASALGEETPDDWRHHYDDTIAAGRGLCDEKLAQLLCEEAPDCIRELEELGRRLGAQEWRHHRHHGAGPRPAALVYARLHQYRSRSVRDLALGDGAHRCDTAKRAIFALSIRSSRDGEVTGAVAYHLGTGAPVVIAAKATVLATNRT